MKQSSQLVPFFNFIASVISKVQIVKPLEDLFLNIKNIQVSDVKQIESSQQTQKNQQKIHQKDVNDTNQNNNQHTQSYKNYQHDENNDNQFIDQKLHKKKNEIDALEDQKVQEQNQNNSQQSQQYRIHVEKQQMKSNRVSKQSEKQQSVYLQPQQRQTGTLQQRVNNLNQWPKIFRKIQSQQIQSFKQLTKAIQNVQIQQPQQQISQDKNRSNIKGYQNFAQENESLRNSALKDQMLGLEDDRNDQYLNARLQENQLKKNLLSKVLSILSKHHNNGVKQAYQSFKCTNLVIDRQFKQQVKITKTFSRKLNSSDSKRKSERANSQDFNFELTMQSKNSKNMLNFSKQDSLMYSNGSDFGAVMERSVSPPKKKISETDSINQKEQSKQRQKSASNKILRKIQDQGDLLQQQKYLLQEPRSIVKIKKSESKQIIVGPYDLQGKKVDQSSIVDEYQVTQDIHMGQQRNSVNERKSEYDEQNALITQSLNFEQQNQHKRRANSLARKRIDTEVDKHIKRKQDSRHSFKKFSKVEDSRLSEQNSNSNIFSTEINSYQLRIAKIKQSKLLKKKKLQQELAKINRDIDQLNTKEEQLIPQIKADFAIRNQISNDKQALSKAESLIKNLRSQKKHRQIAKLSEFKNLDKNINEYMVELSKMREQNEMKLKQKKKLEILDRMKQKQMAKANQRKKKQDNIKFVLHLKSPFKQHRQSQQKMTTPPISKNRLQSNYTEQNQTPQLSHKKAYLSKVRNISVKKSRPDLYQQRLS